MTKELIKIKSTQKDNGERLDKFLSRSTGLSRTRISNLITEGQVSKSGMYITNISQKVKPEEEYTIEIPQNKALDIESNNIPLDIVYEDSDVIVINKQAGLVVHPSAGHSYDTLVNALLYHCKDLSGIGGIERPGIIHRLDKDTTGLMIIAKNDNAHIELSRQFAAHEIEKLYKAIVFGTPRPLSGTITGNIGRSPNNRQKMAVVKNGGKEATTHYKVLSTYCDDTISLVECKLETGRTHQIRVHLSQNGHSLVGDKLYGGNNKRIKSIYSEEIKEAIRQFPRQALHAYKLTFIHPKTRESQTFEIPLPSDMIELATKLQKIND